jgi:hypothetical protein
MLAAEVEGNNLKSERNIFHPQSAFQMGRLAPVASFEAYPLVESK